MKLKSLINQNISNLYKKFTKDNKINEHVELKDKKKQDLSSYVSGEHDQSQYDNAANASVASSLTRDDKIA